jgi:hypothetical protein
MTFTITNTLPADTRVTDHTFASALGREFPVTFNGVTIGGAVLQHAINLGDRVTFVFESDGLTGLAVQGLPEVTS